MLPNTLIKRLEEIGQMLNRWSGQIRMALWGAVILFGLVTFAFSDIWARFERTGRIVTWLILVVLAALAVWQLFKVLNRVQTPEAIAVQVEKTFPQLDNHLINCIQFSYEAAKDPLKAAYVKMGIPHWQGLNFEAMKDKRVFRQALIVLGVSVLLLLIPFPLVGRAWAVAMWRIVNPFSDVQPISLTHILTVTPGDSSIVQGSSVWLTCTVHGQRGHEVCVDIKPSDSAQKTYFLGKLKGTGDEVFSNQIYQATTAIKYRFRAGDSPAPSWYALSLRPPLAFTGVEVTIDPPQYTGLSSRKLDGQAAVFDVPIGSKIELSVKCNAPCESLTVACKEGAGLALSKKKDAQTWTGSLVVTNGVALNLTAISRDGDKTDARLPFNLLPDRAPSIEIVSPKGEATLPPGTAPSIKFTVTDDYGLSEVTVQRMSSASSKDAPAEVLKTYAWITSKTKDYSEVWKGTVRKPSEHEPIILRIVAKDNSPSMNVTMSAPIIFNMLGVEAAAKMRSELEAKAYSDLNKVIELQRTNIDKTQFYQQNLTAATAEQWTDVANRQKEIRTTTKELLDKRVNCLGNLADSVKKLYVEEMVEAISLLEHLANGKSDEKVSLATQSLLVQEKILRQLTFANMAVAKAQIDSRTTQLVGMLDGLIKEQIRIWRVTTQCVAQVTAPSDLIKSQESEAADTYEFSKACHAESEAVMNADKTFGGFLEQMSVACKELKIREDMLLAADQLDKNNFKEAGEKQKSALTKLQDIRSRFDQMKADDDKEKNKEMIEALQNAKRKMEKIKELEKKIVKAMEAVREMKDKDKRQADKMEEEFKEMAKNAEEAMLKIPKDLEIFAELNVANDLSEDVTSTYEEVTQTAGSDQLSKDDLKKELQVAKREGMLDAMQKATDRMDELENWLSNVPHIMGKISTEAFDREEMPNGIALAPLLTKSEDLIGELLKESQEKKDAMNGGAINSALPDMVKDGPVTEGDVTSFAAQGKSGNNEPAHHEQDGRSNVGRQGMSDGETAAGSGTIGKGDDKIEARRTQDPTASGQVNLDGEADTKATGGGKLGTGKADSFGMGGGTKRMDSTEAGSMEGIKNLMMKVADQTYAQANAMGMKSDALKDAVHHTKQLNDAIARGAPIDQVAELKRRALADLKNAKTELSQGNSEMLDTHVTSSLLKDVEQASPEEAPPSYRPLVSEYFKKLNETF